MAFRFTQFKVYTDAKTLHQETVRLTKKFPREFLYLRDQLRRSSLSSVLNIAEGSAKRSDKDFNRYLENSMGSVNETAAAFDVAYSEKLISASELKIILQLCAEVVNQLGGFSEKLSK